MQLPCCPANAPVGGLGGFVALVLPLRRPLSSTLADRAPAALAAAAALVDRGALIVAGTGFLLVAACQARTDGVQRSIRWPNAAVWAKSRVRGRVDAPTRSREASSAQGAAWKHRVDGGSWPGTVGGLTGRQSWRCTRRWCGREARRRVARGSSGWVERPAAERGWLEGPAAVAMCWKVVRARRGAARGSNGFGGVPRETSRANAGALGHRRALPSAATTQDAEQLQQVGREERRCSSGRGGLSATAATVD